MMKMKTFGVALTIALVLAATVNAQRRVNTQPQRQPNKPTPAASPEATSQPQPSPTSDKPVVQDRTTDELTDADRVSLQLKLLTAELKAKTAAYGLKGAQDIKDASEAANDIAEVFEKAARDGQLTDALISKTLNDYFGLRASAQSAPQVTQAVGESSIYFLILQAAQNHVLIEQNKKIIQLLEQLTKTRR